MPTGCGVPEFVRLRCAPLPDALPLAKIVGLTQEQYGANGRELVNPLSNLGTTQYRMGDYKVRGYYLRSVKIAADTGGAR